MLPVPAIGAAYEGGFFAGQISTTANGVATHNLVVAPKSSGHTQRPWKNTNTTTTVSNSTIDGLQNTAELVADGNATIYPAAHYCNDLVIGGFSDWYMPAENEFELCYYNLKPTTDTNNTGFGINANAVPARASNYTSGTPAQTSATDFQVSGTEAFEISYYWSNTQARNLYFGSGFGGLANKTYNFYVRAVRKVAL